jgi:ADP-ribose pyrophosphatase YjhB (NUDIX family)
MSKTVKTTDIKGEEREVLINHLIWRPSVYSIVIKKGKILLFLQFSRTKYDLPGGGVEISESLEEAVFRETKEETGIEIKNPRLLEVRANFFTSQHKPPKHYHSIMFYYACEVSGGKLSKDGFDRHEKEYADMAQWVPLEDLSDIEITSSVDWRPIIKAYYENTWN